MLVPYEYLPAALTAVGGEHVMAVSSLMLCKNLLSLEPRRMVVGLSLSLQYS